MAKNSNSHTCFLAEIVLNFIEVYDVCSSAPSSILTMSLPRPKLFEFCKVTVVRMFLREVCIEGRSCMQALITDG